MAHPEGFKFFYNRFVKEFRPDTDILIRASTYQNKHLPDGYIDQLKAQFPPALIEAYLNGIFCNLTSGIVYNNYDRERNRTDEKWDGEEDIFVGMDFNVTKMSAVVGIFIDHKLHIIDELVNVFDTPAMILLIAEKYGRINRKIHFFTDSSGGSRQTVHASTTDLKLIRDGSSSWRVHTPNRNPRIKDRVLTVNTNFLNARHQTNLYINDKACPTLAEALEQQPYDDNSMPDKKSFKEDHVLDALGYLVIGTMPLKIHRTYKEKPVYRDKYSTGLEGRPIDALTA